MNKKYNNSDEQICHESLKKAEHLVSEVTNKISGADDESDLLDKDIEVQYIISLLSNAQEYDKYIHKFHALDKEALSQSLLSKIEVTKKKRKVSLTKRFAYASVAAAVLFVSMLIYHNDTKSEITESGISNIAMNNIKIDKPVLITYNKDMYELDSKKSVTELIKGITDENIAAKEEKTQTQQISYNTVVVPPKYTYKLELPDGSLVTLNANSTIIFPDAFTEEQRAVKLKGEAFFEVEKSDIPFIVHTNDEAYVRVYGTKFNVNTKKANDITTVLVEGSVGVGLKGGKPVMIEPNQMASLNLLSNSCRISTVDVSNYISWMNGNITATFMSMPEVLDMIADWYGVGFKYDLKAIQNIVLNFSISNSEPLEEVISIIEFTSGKKFILTQNENEYDIR